MAELDLANALAQQAAGGKRRRGPEGGSAAAAPSLALPRWQPLRLGRDFRVGAATEKALHQVAVTMNRTLRPEGLMVNIVTDTPQGKAEMPVLVAEARGGKVVRAYDEAGFLSVFAKQRQQNGVIVDGQA